MLEEHADAFQVDKETNWKLSIFTVGWVGNPYRKRLSWLFIHCWLTLLDSRFIALYRHPFLAFRSGFLFEVWHCCRGLSLVSTMRSSYRVIVIVEID